MKTNPYAIVTESMVQYVASHLPDVNVVKKQLAEVYHTYGTVNHEFHGQMSIPGTKQRKQLVGHTLFNEGYLIREVLRECPECVDWTLRDRLNVWAVIAERLIGIQYENAEDTA